MSKSFLGFLGLSRVWGKMKNYIDNNTLTKTNTTAFTPTENYHPATKKYVDDSIASAITSAIGGSY